jgi:hypothetical protein
VLRLVRDGQLRPRAIAHVVFLGYLLVALGWAAAAPYNGVSDEAAHAIHAYAVVDGQLFSPPAAASHGTGAYQTVPVSLLPEDRTCIPTPILLLHDGPQCATQMGDDQTLVRTGSWTGRYNPVYYLIAGWPIHLWPNYAGILLTRAITAGIVAALLGWAAYIAVRWLRRPLLTAAVFIGVTPVALEYAGAVNPAAIEIAAGVAVALGALALFERPDKIPGRLLRGTAASAVVLVLPRALGPGWLLAILLVVALSFPGRNTVALIRNRGIQICSAVVLLATLVGASWTVVMKSYQVLQFPYPLTHAELLATVVHGQWWNWIVGAVGTFGWSEYTAPGWTELPWFLAFGLLTLMAVIFGGWADRWRVIAPVVIAFGLGTAEIVVNGASFGYAAWQGRYVLPLTAGIAVYAAYTLSTLDWFRPAIQAKLARGLALTVLPTHVLMVYFVQLYWTRGPYLLLDPLGPRYWQSLFGPVIPLLLAAAGAGVLYLAVWHATQPAAPQPEPAVGPVATEAEFASWEAGEQPDPSRPRPDQAARDRAAA